VLSTEIRNSRRHAVVSGFLAYPEAQLEHEVVLLQPSQPEGHSTPVQHIIIG